MKIESPYLFAYGTLRTDIDVPVKEQVSQYLEVVGEAEISGKLYDMGGYPGAVQAEAGEESVIKGQVMKVNEPEKVFAILDKYEGCHPDSKESSTYYRQPVSVPLPGGQQVEAWVYWYIRPVEEVKRIRHKDYLEYLREKKNVY